ncbi:MAG: DUF2383 domain-containing protein [Polyangiaceae bacterium]
MAVAWEALSASEASAAEVVVRELIEASEDRERTFLGIASAVEDQELESVLEHYAGKHSACARELREYARGVFQDLPPRKMASGQFVRVRMSRPSSQASVLAECILHEDAMLVSYERVLLRDLPADIERTIRRHHALIKEARTQLAILCSAVQ